MVSRESELSLCAWRDEHALSRDYRGRGVHSRVGLVEHVDEEFVARDAAEDLRGIRFTHISRPDAVRFGLWMVF